MNEKRVVTDADDGIRLDRWFKRHFPAITHGLLEKSLRKGQVKLDGKKTKSNARVATGQTIEMHMQVADSAKTAAPKVVRTLSDDDVRAVKNMVLYKDENVIIINKPPGLAVQGGTGQGRHLDAMLDGLKYDGERPKLVHRLDMDTSGCLALGRTAKAAAVLARKFAEHETLKIYHALIIGLPLPMKGVVDLPLYKGENPEADPEEKKSAPRRTRGGVKDPTSKDPVKEKVFVHAEGQRALTEYRVMEHCANKVSWVELTPMTGRTHQLRVHMTALGHPIVGDGKYGGKDAFVHGSLGVSKKLHLHAAQLVIPDVFGKTIDVKAPLPPHIKNSLKELGII